MNVIIILNTCENVAKIVFTGYVLQQLFCFRLDLRQGYTCSTFGKFYCNVARRPIRLIVKQTNGILPVRYVTDHAVNKKQIVTVTQLGHISATAVRVCIRYSWHARGEDMRAKTSIFISTLVQQCGLLAAGQSTVAVLHSADSFPLRYAYLPLIDDMASVIASASKSVTKPAAP